MAPRPTRIVNLARSYDYYHHSGFERLGQCSLGVLEGWRVEDGQVVSNHVLFGGIVLEGRPLRIYRHRLPPSEIQEYYDRLSKSYSVLYGPEQAVKHEKVLDEMGKRKYDVFVDIGCGDGVLLSRALPGSNLQVGLDLSPGMLQKARQIMEGMGSLVRCDASHLPLRGGVADCVVSISLSDRENIEALTSEVARIARNDATILLSIIHPYGMPSANFAELKLLDISLFSPKETLFVLAKCGRPMLKNEWRGIDEGR